MRHTINAETTVTTAADVPFAADQQRTDDMNAKSAADDVSLNPKYTFEAFIVGKANELAHAASLAAAANPGESYNPLFIYGSAGLGKTHLLQAIGHHVVKSRPSASVLYVTCERFTNEFIQAVRGGRVNDFKDNYRNVDVLLMDDIQFISGKQGTQELSLIHI